MRRLMIVVAATVLMTAGAAAQSASEHPGYFPIESMGLVDAGALDVNIDLEGPMLQVAAGAMQEEGESAELTGLVSQLERVRVQVGPLRAADASAAAASIAAAASRMESEGWKRILSVVESDEQVYLFARQSGELISGLTVIVNDGGDEVVLVNVAGAIDPVLLGRLLANLDDLPDFSSYVDVQP